MIISSNKKRNLINNLFFKMNRKDYKPDLIITLGLDNADTALKLKEKYEIDIDLENININNHGEISNFSRLNYNFLANKEILIININSDFKRINPFINYLNLNFIDIKVSIGVLVHNSSHVFEYDDRFQFYYASKN
jgi:hypothetical protein